MDPQLDGLTKLYNRHYLQTLGASLCEQAQADDRLLGLIFADIDGMKTVDDFLGFPAGDRLIVRFAQIIQSHLHDGAVAGRIGGDEFLVIAPVKSEAELAALAEAIREEAKTVVVMSGSYDEVSSDPVTLTLGLSCLPHHGSNLKSLWIAAERASYYGKHSGKDRVCWSEAV